MILKAGTILINKDKKAIGLVKRKKHNDISFPKGHVEENESLLDCAIRETIEETGRKCRVLKNEPIYIDQYNNKEGLVKVYYYLVEDLGEINKKIDEELLWVNIDKVNDYLTYDVLKEMYTKIYDTILSDM